MAVSSARGRRTSTHWASTRRICGRGSRGRHSSRPGRGGARASARCRARSARTRCGRCRGRDDASVGALRGGPLAQDPGEVVDAVGDDDPMLGRGERENVVVVEAFQRGLLVACPYVVSVLLEPASHLGSGYVGVEQQPHAAGLPAGLQERIQLSQLAERAPAVLDEGRDLVGEALAVGARGARGVRRSGVRRAQPLLVARVGAQQLEDLPDVEAGPPSPTLGVVSRGTPRREQARLGHPLGKLLDHHAAIDPSASPHRAQAGRRVRPGGSRTAATSRWRALRHEPHIGHRRPSQCPIQEKRMQSADIELAPLGRENPQICRDYAAVREILVHD
jgi:hypothetical protein